MALTLTTVNSIGAIGYLKTLLKSWKTAIDAWVISTEASIGAKAAAATSPTISSGTSAPSSTPAKVGDLYVNTTAGALYFAKAATASTDWVLTTGEDA